MENQDQEFHVPQKKIDELLTGISSSADRFFITETFKPKVLTDEEIISDYKKIKQIFDKISFEEDNLYQSERLTLFIEEVKRRLSK